MNATHNGSATATPPAPVSVPKLWLTAADVAKLLSIGVRTVWRMVKQGRLPQPYRFTRKLVRFDRETLIQFARELREEPEGGHAGS